MEQPIEVQKTVLLGQAKVTRPSITISRTKSMMNRNRLKSEVIILIYQTKIETIDCNLVAKIL